MLLVGFLVAPLFAGDYVLTVLILILYFAYTGQAWNIMMGFAGQLSLGHALYVGLGAYSAAALYVHFGLGPWIGLLVAVPVAALAGAFIGFLAFRFRVAGVYFAILTIAFAEFARVGFDHFGWTNASSGLFLPVAQYARNDLWQLRGHPVMFYYVLLAATVLAFILCRALLKSRIGYFWLAIREDEEAARSVGIDVFHYKMIAVVISAAMTSFAGVVYAFYYNNLFPEQVFNISRSIDIILGPIVGGVGTLFGPILGEFRDRDHRRRGCEVCWNRSASTCLASSRWCSALSCCSLCHCHARRGLALARAQTRPDGAAEMTRAPFSQRRYQAISRPARGRRRDF